MRVLLVEDDELLGDGLRKDLVHEGYAVDWVKDGSAANHALQAEDFDLMVLDLGLPKLSGTELLKIVRGRGQTLPVLILTAYDSIEDKVKALDSGADDYLTKPFDLKEVSARLRALQRRFYDRAAPVIKYRNIELDPASHSVTLDGQDVNIPRREFALLQKLLESPGRALSREQLNQTLYGWGEEIDSNALEVHIHNLRKKFGTDIIKTIRGVGYMTEKDSKEI